MGRILLGLEELTSTDDPPRRSGFIVSRDEVLTDYHCLFQDDRAAPAAPAWRAVDKSARPARRPGLPSGESPGGVTTADTLSQPWLEYGIWFRLPWAAADEADLDVPMVVSWIDEQLDVALLRMDAAALQPGELRARRALFGRQALRPRRSIPGLMRVTLSGFSSSSRGRSPDRWSGEIVDLERRASNGAPAITVHADEPAAGAPAAVRGFSGGPVVLDRGRRRGQAIAIVRESLNTSKGAAIGGDVYATPLRDVAARSNRVRTLTRRATLRRRSPVAAVAALLTICLAILVVSFLPRSPSLIGNPSNRRGGDLRLVVSSQEDRLHLNSLDPAIDDSPSGINLMRLLNRTLVTFRSSPDDRGLGLVGDLAEGLGVPTDNAQTWTYHLRRGMTFDDGAPVRAADVRYALERSFASGTLGGRPRPGADVLDLRSLLDPNGRYAGPLPGHPGLSSISTPDDRTIVFHLTRPCADWDRYMTLPMSAPVPRARDTGADYGLSPASTGPYEVQTLKPWHEAILVRNPTWRSRTDPERRALPDRIIIEVLPSQDEVDREILDDVADVDLGHSGALDHIQSIATTAPLEARSTLVPDSLSYFLALATTVAPLDNIHCRRAIFYAADPNALLTALGGKSQVLPIGSVAIPDVITESTSDSLAGRYPHGGGRVEQELQLCGHPQGFSVTIPVRDAPARGNSTAQLVATALQKSLEPLGIMVRTEKVLWTDYDAEIQDPNVIQKKGWGLVWSGIEPLVVSPYGYFWAFHSNRPAGAGSNPTRFSDPDLDKLIDFASTQTIPTDAATAWSAVNNKIPDFAVVMPVAHSLDFRMTSARTTNVYTLKSVGQYDLAALGVR